MVGMRDKGLSEQLQLDPELTVEHVKKRMRQKEAVKEQNQQLRAQGRPDFGPVDAVQMAAGEQACSRDLEDTELTPAERAVVDAMRAAGQGSQRTAKPGNLRTGRPSRGGKCT